MDLHSDLRHRFLNRLDYEWTDSVWVQTATNEPWFANWFVAESDDMPFERAPVEGRDPPCLTL